MKYLFLPNEYSQQRQQEKPVNIYPVLMAMQATYLRNQGHNVDWNNQVAGKQYNKIIRNERSLEIPFMSLPAPDRVWTNAMNPKYQKNGNFKHLPGTYIMSAGGCWHGKCSFCVEKVKPYEVRPVDDVIEEIKECKAMGCREVFDDSATFPIGRWLDDFIRKFTTINNGIRFSCNWRLIDTDYNALRRANFRMLLFGVESANQVTLDRINKGVKVEDIKYIKKAAEAGLEPHIAVMFGYAWETDADAIRTLKLVHDLLRRGYAKTAQASLFSQLANDTNVQQKTFVRKIYGVWKSPQFWFNKIRDIHNTDDLKYLWRQIKNGIDTWKKEGVKYEK